MLKIGSMVGAPDLETATLAPFSGDLETAFQKLATLGYEGAEIMLKNPAKLDGRGIREALDENNLRLIALCTGHIYGEDRLGLVGPDLKIDPAAVARLEEFIDFAALHFGPGTLVNIGRSRGPGNPLDPEKSLGLYREAFQALADYALPQGVRLILEPINRDEVSFIHSTQDGLRMARWVDRPNFGLMLDTYHMHREDPDLFESFREAAGCFWHVHFSDANRRWPGNSHIDFGRIVRVLNETGFDGFVSLEIEPWPGPDEAARFSIDYLRRFIPSTT
jgi:sugar phosphate isomerase/epimerase